MKTVPEKLLAKRLELGLSQTAFGEPVGVDQSSVDRIEKGRYKRIPSGLPRLLRHYGIEVDRNDPLWDHVSLISAPTPRHPDSFKPEPTPGRDLVGAQGFPIYAAAQGGDGHLIITHDAIEHVKWPSILEGVKGAYGIRIVGDSMEPAYFQGDMALVHPSLPPQRGRDGILYAHNHPDGDAEAIVKHLVGWTESEWILKQYNPSREWREPRADWPTVHMIVGRYNAR